MRLFVGLELPWELRRRLDAMSDSLPSAHWTPVDNFHLTLRFIGEAPPHHAEEIDLALSALRGRSFSFALSGVGVRDKAGRTVSLWAGVERNPALEHLQGKIETALQRAGCEPMRRRWTPHVTLARLDGVPEHKTAAFIQAHNLFRSEPVPAPHFTLFSSRLGKEASVYTPEVEYVLA